MTETNRYATESTVKSQLGPRSHAHRWTDVNMAGRQITLRELHLATRTTTTTLNSASINQYVRSWGVHGNWRTVEKPMAIELFVTL